MGNDGKTWWLENNDIKETRHVAVEKMGLIGGKRACLALSSNGVLNSVLRLGCDEIGRASNKVAQNSFQCGTVILMGFPTVRRVEERQIPSCFKMWREEFNETLYRRDSFLLP